MANEYREEVERLRAKIRKRMREAEKFTEREAEEVISLLCERLDMSKPRLIVANDRNRFFLLTDFYPEEVKAHYIPKYKGVLRIDEEFIVDNWIVAWKPDLSLDVIIHELTHHWLHEAGWFEKFIEEEIAPTEAMLELAVKNFSEELLGCYGDPSECEGLRVGEKEW